MSAYHEDHEKPAEQKTQKKRKLLFDIKVEVQCPICYEELDQENAHVTSCKHSFHKDCINIWFKTNDTCPRCRSLLITRARAQLTEEAIDNELIRRFWSRRGVDGQ